MYANTCTRFHKTSREISAPHDSVRRMKRSMHLWIWVLAPPSARSIPGAPGFRPKQVSIPGLKHQTRTWGHRFPGLPEPASSVQVIHQVSPCSPMFPQAHIPYLLQQTLVRGLQLESESRTTPLDSGPSLTSALGQFL